MAGVILKDALEKIWPNTPIEELDELLWTCTAYPACSLDKAFEVLTGLYAEHKGNAQAAINASLKEFDDEWAKYKAARDRGDFKDQM